MAILSSISFGSTGYLQLPVGNTAQRPAETVTTLVSFTSVGSTNWTVPANVNQVEVLVVAGGGGGGAWVGGGGGAGGVVYRENYPVTPGESIAVTVGAGGTGEYNPGSYGGMPRATNGGNSSFGTLTAIGGGYGGSWDPYPAQSGGSGGGNGYLYVGAAGTTGQGFPGGRGRGDSSNGYPTGGGGGAGGPGQDWGQGGSAQNTNGSYAPNGKCGDGGPGLPFNITGSTIWVGGGGGGGVHGNSSNAIPGKGGLGGGGTGAAVNGSRESQQNGSPNTGGGGGGGGGPGGSASYGGNGGSGVVYVRYATGNTTILRPGALRVNTQRGLEYYSGNSVWVPMAVPFIARQIITTSYMAGGYQSSSAWNNVNRCSNSTDTTYNLGDNSISRSFNYQSGACNHNVGFIFGAGNAHATASNVVVAFNMRTDQQYAGAYDNIQNNRYNSGTLFKEQYKSWTTGGGSSDIEEYNLVTENWLRVIGGFSSTGMNAMSHENYGVWTWENDSRVWHFTTLITQTRGGTQPSNHHQQKSVQSKLTNCYMGNEGSYNGGYNLRISNMYTNSTSGTVGKPRSNCGEENFTLGQDWQYMLGNYDGTQNNGSWKFYYATQSGFNTNSTTEPKGKGGSSSGHCWWRN